MVRANVGAGLSCIQATMPSHGGAGDVCRKVWVRGGWVRFAAVNLDPHGRVENGWLAPDRLADLSIPLGKQVFFMGGTWVEFLGDGTVKQGTLAQETPVWRLGIASEIPKVLPPILPAGTRIEFDAAGDLRTIELASECSAIGGEKYSPGTILSLNVTGSALTDEGFIPTGSGSWLVKYPAI